MRHISTTLFSALLLVSASASAALAWGAIAVDHDAGEDPDASGYALVTDSPTRAGASADALATCREAGNANCAVVLTFQKCGAYAASLANYGVGAGTGAREAEQRALADCGGPDCRIVVSDCQ